MWRPTPAVTGRERASHQSNGVSLSEQSSLRTPYRAAGVPIYGAESETAGKSRRTPSAAAQRPHRGLAGTPSLDDWVAYIVKSQSKGLILADRASERKVRALLSRMQELPKREVEKGRKRLAPRAQICRLAQERATRSKLWDSLIGTISPY